MTFSIERQKAGEGHEVYEKRKGGPPEGTIESHAEPIWENLIVVDRGSWKT